jgi:hypothetical protein
MPPFADYSGVFLIGGPHYAPLPRRRAAIREGHQGHNVSLAWVLEHEERRVRDDCFVLEYVSQFLIDLAAVDRETVEAFELIRLISELWGLKVAKRIRFPTVTTQRKVFHLSLRRMRWRMEL